MHTGTVQIHVVIMVCSHSEGQLYWHEHMVQMHVTTGLLTLHQSDGHGDGTRCKQAKPCCATAIHADRNEFQPFDPVMLMQLPDCSKVQMALTQRLASEKAMHQVSSITLSKTLSITVLSPAHAQMPYRSNKHLVSRKGKSWSAWRYVQANVKHTSVHHCGQKHTTELLAVLHLSSKPDLPAPWTLPLDCCAPHPQQTASLCGQNPTQLLFLLRAELCRKRHLQLHEQITVQALLLTYRHTLPLENPDFSMIDRWTDRYI